MRVRQRQRDRETERQRDRKKDRKKERKREGGWVLVGVSHSALFNHITWLSKSRWKTREDIH